MTFYPVAWYLLCDYQDIHLAPKTPSLESHVLTGEKEDDFNHRPYESILKGSAMFPVYLLFVE